MQKKNIINFAISVYLFFEFTTMLVMCIMPTAIMQFNRLIKCKILLFIINIFCVVFTILMVAGRLISGVHWFTDILGGIILSISLVMFYYSVVQLVKKSNIFSE